MAGDNGIDALRSGLSGDAFEPGDPEYDEARQGWELADTSQPALVLLPEGSGDVAAAVAHAREAGLAIGVKGNGTRRAPLRGRPAAQHVADERGLDRPRGPNRANRGVLPSFLVGADPPDRLRTCYTPDALERLGKIAEERDPDALFRFNSQVR